MKKIRSKHNNLLNFFLYDKKNLSDAYVKKCETFLNDLKKEMTQKRITFEPKIKTITNKDK